MRSADHFKREIAKLSRTFHLRGWSLATSGNYSIRVSDNQILITASSLDKSTLSENDMVVIDLSGDPQGADMGLKPSAESVLHCGLYRHLPGISAVLHTHSIYSTVLSIMGHQEIVLQGYEMLKALRGVSSHEHREILPILPNSQDMKELASTAKDYLAKNPNAHGFLIHAHGLYTWGADLAEAKRHTEALEFLLECEYRKRMLQL